LIARLSLIVTDYSYKTLR